MSSRHRVDLIRHRDSQGNAAVHLSAGIARGARTALTVTYELTGSTGLIVLPGTERSERRDALWTATCFELFARSADGSYLEWNFAPSTAWAAYRFDGYRSGMRHAPVDPPWIGTESADGRFVMHVTLDAALMPPAASWRAGLSAVIRETDGATSWWALAHPAGKPDFHHADCFALDLAPSRGS